MTLQILVIKWHIISLKKGTLHIEKMVLKGLEITGKYFS